MSVATLAGIDPRIKPRPDFECIFKFSFGRLHTGIFKGIIDFLFVSLAAILKMMVQKKEEVSIKV